MAKCVYCGEKEGATSDHVVSKNLFPEAYVKKNVITAPSCHECNKGFSLDEEYLRLFLCAIALEDSKHARNLFFSKIKRSVQRRPLIGEKMLSKMDLVRVYQKGGLVPKERTKLEIDQEDEKRFSNVLNKHIKGLFFYEFNEILPKELEVKHSLNFRREDDIGIFKVLKKSNLDNVEIFAYGYNFVPNTYNSIWVTVFYNCLFFISAVGSTEDFKRFMPPEGKKSF